jgi:hypothetical protein
MSTSIHVTDGSGNPIDNATISCNGCTVMSGGNGFYTVDVDLTPISGGFGVAAPGFLPTFCTWWNTALSGGAVPLSRLPGTDAGIGTDDTGDTGDPGAAANKW